jgi:hypothetical protein
MRVSFITNKWSVHMLLHSTMALFKLYMYSYSLIPSSVLWSRDVYLATDLKIHLRSDLLSCSFTAGQFSVQFSSGGTAINWYNISSVSLLPSINLRWVLLNIHGFVHFYVRHCYLRKIKYIPSNHIILFVQLFVVCNFSYSNVLTQLFQSALNFFVHTGSFVKVVPKYIKSSRLHFLPYQPSH